MLFLYGLITLAITALCSARKPYKLAVLDMIAFTGNPPNDGSGCKAASQIAIDFANNRTDFLSDYEIETRFADENAGQLTARRVIEYIRSFKEDHHDHGEHANRTYQSPVIIGSLHSAGCKSMGRFLHFENSININVACGAPFLSDRHLYPNLYMMRSTGRVLSHAQLHFIKDVGKWNRIAIIAYAENIFDYVSATFLQQLALDNKVEVTLFDYVIDIDDDSINELKRVDARIIVFFCSTSRMIWKFLCHTFNRGVTGSRYVFIILGVQFSDPYNLHEDQLGENCTRKIIIEQLQYAFVTAPVMYTDSPTTVTTLGYNTFEFDRMFDLYTNSARPVDYEFRFLCHDTVLQSLITLDQADRQLRAKLNLSLRSYHSYPRKVMEIVNQSAIQVDYVGLRMGRMRYNSRGEVDADPQMISQWSPSTSLKYIYLVKQLVNASGYDYRDYWVENMAKPRWMTANGKPPRDKWTERRVFSEVSYSAFTGVTIVAALLACLQCLAVVQTIRAWILFGIEASSSHILPISKCIGYSGCLVLNVAAVIFTVDSRPYPQAIWEVRIVALLLGISITLSSLFSRIAVIWQAVRSLSRKIQEQQSYRQAREIPLESVDYSAFFNKELFSKLERRSLVCATAFFVLTNSYIINWLLWDPLKCQFSKITQQPIYIYEEDVMLDAQVITCNSSGQIAWIAIMTAAIFFVLILGCLFARSVYYLTPSMKKYPDIATIYIVMLTIIMTLLACSILIGVINQMERQQIVAALGCLLISTLTTGIMFFNGLFHHYVSGEGNSGFVPVDAISVVSGHGVNERRRRRRGDGGSGGNTSNQTATSNNNVTVRSGDGIVLRMMRVMVSVSSTNSQRTNLVRPIGGGGGNGSTLSEPSIAGTIGGTSIIQTGSIIPVLDEGVV